MNKVFWLLLCVLVLSSYRFDSSNPEGINFFEGKLKEASAEAKKENRPLFVFIGSSECDICRKMKGVFKNPKVVDYYESNFICYKIIDPEKNFLTYNKVTGWGMKTVPTFVYFTPNGKKIFIIDGYKDPGEFINQGINVLDLIKTDEDKKKK